jgi:hypothetical protein
MAPARVVGFKWRRLQPVAFGSAQAQCPRNQNPQAEACATKTRVRMYGFTYSIGREALDHGQSSWLATKPAATGLRSM